MSSHLESLVAAAADKAMVELSKKTIHTVNFETAITWAGRALAAYAIYERTGNVHMLLDAEAYSDEAIEHAALAGPGDPKDEIAFFVRSARVRLLGQRDTAHELHPELDGIG